MRDKNMPNSPAEKHSPSRIAVIGCGNVGTTSAYSLLLKGIAREIVLLDVNHERAIGEAMDLQHSVPLASPTRIWAGDFADAAAADIAVIAAGVGGRPGESRLDLLGRNVVVIREVVENLMRAGFDGLILMTTNPVDILAQVAQRQSELPAARVISSGTVLDTARLRTILGERLGVEARSVHAYIIGEHGNSEIATWSSATVAGVPLRDYARPQRLDYDEILRQVREAAPQIIKYKGYTSAAIASCVTRICEAVLRDERTILPVSTLAAGQYGIREVYLSLPCVVGREGVEKIIEVPLDENEQQGLKASAEILRRTFDSIDGGR
jgi:L-lactate dehydrogenase